MDLFTLVAKIGLDSKEYEQGIKGAKQGFEKLDTWMVAKAQLIADGVKRAFSTIADFAKDAVTAAADVAAEKAQFAATFEGIEEAANGVLASVSNDTGILATRLQQVGTKAFSQFKGAGIDAAGALSMMDEYTRIAADAAAYYDISLEDADVRLRSFLRGNTEAGDAIGLFTSESQRNSKAVELYGKKWTKLTEAQKQNLMLNVAQEIYDQSGATGQAAREMDGWVNVVGNLQRVWKDVIAIIGAPFYESLTPVVQKLSNFLGDDTIQMRIGMLASSLSDATGWVFDGIIDLLDKILEWSSGDEEFKIDIHIPTWEEIQTTAETALTTIQNGIKGFATWTLGAFTLDGVSIPEILQTAKTWWNGQGANTYERLKSVFTWTLGNFVAPNVEGFFDGASTWWEETAQPALTAITQWSFGELIVPAWGDFALSVKNWWINDFLPSMTAILTWNLGDLKLPSIEDVQEKISTWWNTVKAGLKLSFSASYSRTFSQAELEQGQKDYKDEIDAISSPSLAPWSSKKNAPSKATGLDYVPYDNFIAKLHAGETVLNRADATAYRARNVGGISAESLSQAVAVAVREALDGVGVYMGADRVGDLVTQRVSRNIAKGARAMRYANV
nr:MAG TPA: hypothetical protein [Caudoviricetes sp.]